MRIPSRSGPVTTAATALLSLAACQAQPSTFTSKPSWVTAAKTVVSNDGQIVLTTVNMTTKDWLAANRAFAAGFKGSRLMSARFADGTHAKAAAPDINRLYEDIGATVANHAGPGPTVITVGTDHRASTGPSLIRFHCDRLAEITAIQMEYTITCSLQGITPANESGRQISLKSPRRRQLAPSLIPVS